MRKGMGCLGRPSGCVQLGGHSSAHPQAQHVCRVTLLALQPVHARTSLRMSSTVSLIPVPLPAPGVTSGAPESLPRAQHRPIPRGVGLSGCRLCRQGGGRGGGDGHKQTGSGSYGSARKADLSLHPCSSWGTLEGREDEGEGCSVWGQPFCPGSFPSLPVGHKEDDGDGDLPMVPLGPAALAPPANNGEGKGITTGTTWHLSHGDAPHSCQEPTFSPFTLAVTTVPSGLMMTPGSPFSPCKRRGGGRGHGGTRLPSMTELVSPGGQVE